MKDLEVEGYLYDNRVWGWCDHPDRPPPKTREPCWLRDEVLAGREIQAELTEEALAWPGGKSRYAFQADTTPDGNKRARALWRSNRKQHSASGAKDIIGICRMGRLENDAIVEEKAIVLTGLDEMHVMDRLTGEMWRWHASVFGPGPRSPKGHAHHDHARLDEKIPSTPTTQPRQKCRL